MLKINHKIQRRNFKKFHADVFGDDLYATLNNFSALPDITSENFNKIFDDHAITILTKIDPHAQVTKLLLQLHSEQSSRESKPSLSR